MHIQNQTKAVAVATRLPGSGEQSIRWVPWSVLVLVLLVFWTHSAVAKEVTDVQIATAINSDLWFDEVLDANNIDVTVTDGIVTFSGTVDNILARERATAMASATVGVRSVVNSIDVVPSIRIGDTELAQAVELALLDDPATDSYEIRVSANVGLVTLTGTVQSWQEKQLCTTVAKGVHGVRGITNDIVIDFVLDRPDMEIKPEIEQRLAYDVRVDDALIEVEVNDGQVTLTGTVGSLTEKNRAVTDAWVGSVKSVDADKLKIRWWARDEMRRESTYVTKPDEELEKAVQDALLYDPRVKSFNPVILVDGGTVTLTGFVNNIQAKQAAEEDARNTVGVWRVKNYLKVRPEIIPPNEELERRVSSAIGRNPYVSQLDVGVRATYGRVTLVGEVNNSFEKAVVTQVASAVKGVIVVRNNLDYKYDWVRRPDWEIRDDVTYKVFWSPFVDEGQVEVAVDRGIVTLSGNVETWSERLNAESCAWQGGAKDVRNELTVSYQHYGPYPFMWPYLSPDKTMVIPPAWVLPPGKM